MNIFILDHEVSKCAQYHGDKHVVKMVLETAQILCSAYHLLTNKDAPYRLTHKSHPCVVWATSCSENYDYLVELGLALAKEYMYRYGKTHKSEAVIKWCLENKPKGMPLKGSLDFISVVPAHCKSENVVEAYRNYYRIEKSHIAIWTRRPTPYWWYKSKEN